MRENRTSGSGQGAPGNRRSYCETGQSPFQRWCCYCLPSRCLAAFVRGFFEKPCCQQKEIMCPLHLGWLTARDRLSGINTENIR